MVLFWISIQQVPVVAVQHSKALIYNSTGKQLLVAGRQGILPQSQPGPSALLELSYSIRGAYKKQQVSRFPPPKHNLISLGEVPAVIEALRIFCRTRLAYLTGASFTLSLLPLPPEYLLGNRGNAYLAFLSPLTMLVACGLVSLTWYILAILMYIVGSIGSCFSSRYAFSALFSILYLTPM